VPGPGDLFIVEMIAERSRLADYQDLNNQDLDDPVNSRTGTSMRVLSFKARQG